VARGRYRSSPVDAGLRKHGESDQDPTAGSTARRRDPPLLQLMIRIDPHTGQSSIQTARECAAISTTISSHATAADLFVLILFRLVPFPRIRLRH